MEDKNTVGPGAVQLLRYVGRKASLTSQMHRPVFPRRMVSLFLRFSSFSTAGYSDLGGSETPLLYSLLVTRCREGYCEDFCVYRGSRPEHSAFLPPGFSSAQHRLSVSISVEDHQGAAIRALNK